MSVEQINIPSAWLNAGGLLAGWFIALAIEKRYVSRSAQIFITLDAFALMKGHIFIMKWLETKNFWVACEAWKLPCLLKLYFFVGIVLGLWGLKSYVAKKSLSTTFYDITYFCYSSKTAMPLSTAFVHFSSYYPELLYTELFWLAFVGRCALAWFPPILTIAIGWLCTVYLRT